MLSGVTLSQAGAGRRTEAAAPLGASTIYACVAAAMLAYAYHLFGLGDRYPGNLSDARFNQAVLEHLWLWAQGRADSLSDTAYFYPYRDIFYFSDTHFGAGAIYVAARALGATREAAFNVWYFCGVASTFAAAAYAFRKLGGSAPAAAVGACLFTLSLPMLAQDVHAQFVYRFGVPLAVLAFVRFVQRPSLRPALEIAIWTFWQFLCSFYIGVFLVELLAALAAMAVVRPALFPRIEANDTPARPGSTAALAALAAVFAALTGYMLLRHVQTVKFYDIRRDLWQIEACAPHWYSLLAMQGAPSVAWLTRYLPNDGIYWEWEHQLFPGIGSLFLAGAGVWLCWRDAKGRAVAAVCLVAIFALLLPAMDFGGFGLYRYMASVPGLNAIRSGGRVVLVLAFALAWLAVLGFDALQRSQAPAARAALIFGLGMALFDIATFRASSVNVAAARARVAAMTSQLDGESLRARRAVLARLSGEKTHGERAMYDIDLMLAAQELNVSSLNGYSGSYPPGHERPRNCAELKAWLPKLDALPYNRAGAEGLAQRVFVLPVGACDAGKP